MAILAALESNEEMGERRASVRRQLRLITEGTTPSSAHERVIICDLSVSGILVEGSSSLAVGDLLTVRLPESAAVEAIVMWNSGNYFGCKFTRPISTAVLAAAQLLSPAAPIEGDRAVISIALAELQALRARIHHITQAVDRTVAFIQNDPDGY